MADKHTLEESKIIDVKQAVRLAKKYFDELYEGEDLPNVLLEEIEITEDEKLWLITFGYDTDHTVELPYDTVLGPRVRHLRDYKTVEVDAVTGELIALKIRKV